MSFSSDSLLYIVCPQCKGDLRYTKEEVLFCMRCRVCYPIKEGVPDLSVEAWLPLSVEGKIVEREKIASFSIEKGPDAGVTFSLERGTCMAIGRHFEDMNQTQIYNVDFNMSFDDHTKKLIKNYLSKTSGTKKSQNKLTEKTTELGSFQRISDLILNDPGVSRLHAMLFYDEKGAGILDLVSRNGTFINGREVEASRLESADQIEIGQTVIRLEIK